MGGRPCLLLYSFRSASGGRSDCRSANAVLPSFPFWWAHFVVIVVTVLTREAFLAAPKVCERQVWPEEWKASVFGYDRTVSECEEVLHPTSSVG